MATLIVALRVPIMSMMVSRTFNELHNLCEGEGSRVDLLPDVLELEQL